MTLDFVAFMLCSRYNIWYGPYRGRDSQRYPPRTCIQRWSRLMTEILYQLRSTWFRRPRGHGEDGLWGVYGIVW